MKIETDEYQVNYDTENGVICCAGALRLGGAEEYAPMMEILGEAANAPSPQLTLDLRDLHFLNSFGINVLSKFVIDVRKKGTSALRVVGSQSVPWQGKSLVNLQRLMPNLELVIE